MSQLLRRRKVSHPRGNINKLMGECKCVSFTETFHITTKFSLQGVPTIMTNYGITLTHFMSENSLYYKAY